MRKTESVVEKSPLPPVEPRSENKNIDTADDHSKSSTNHLPQDTAAENAHKSPISPGAVSPPAHEMRARETKKSRVGIFVVVTLVVVASVVGVYKLFSGKSSSTKFAEVKIISTPKGAAVAIDSKDAGDTPKTAVNLTSGKHIFDFSKKGYQSRSIEISLVEGKNPDVQVTLEKSQQSKASSGERPEATAGQPVSAVKPTRPEPTTPRTYSYNPATGKPATPPVKQASPSPAKVLEKPIDERIQEAIDLYDKQQYGEAARKFKAILEVVPNNALAKFYLKRSLEAGNKE